MKPMLARLVRELPLGDYVYEPKWDGFRCLAERRGDEIELTSRHERPLTRYFPEIATALATVEPPAWTLDGELVVLADGRFDFAALMQRLHPSATRVRELADATPAAYVAFDLIAIGGEDLAEHPFEERRTRLAAMLAGARSPLFATPATEDPSVAAGWLGRFRGGGIDGVVAKHRELPYQPGARAMLKVKHERTADCVVAGVRVADDPVQVWSLLLGLYDSAGALRHIGVASSFTQRRRLELAGELAPLIAPLEGHPWERGFLAEGGPMGRLKGAAGRWMPGMTLDWVPLAPVRVAEVTYTQIDDRRLRHPARLVRWRPDREPRSCSIEQLDVDAPPVADLLAG